MLGNGYLNQTNMPTTMREVNSETPSKLISTRVVSSTPGRLRIRVAPQYRQSGAMADIAKALNARPHVNQVRINVQHGSITINHKGEDGTLDDVFATLRDLGIIFRDVTEGNTEAAADLTSAVVDLNKRVKQATNGLVDLRFLFPLGLSTLAVRQLIIKGLQFETIPWYVLAWYAFDSFMKLHSTNHTQAPNK